MDRIDEEFKNVYGVYPSFLEKEQFLRGRSHLPNESDKRMMRKIKNDYSEWRKDRKAIIVIQKEEDKRKMDEARKFLKTKDQDIFNTQSRTKTLQKRELVEELQKNYDLNIKQVAELIGLTSGGVRYVLVGNIYKRSGKKSKKK